MADTDATFGLHLKRLRAERGLTYRKLAEDCGMAYSILHRAEHGKGTSLAHAARIAEALGSSLAGMLQPVSCFRCCDTPPPGFSCNACGAQGEESAS